MAKPTPKIIAITHRTILEAVDDVSLDGRPANRKAI